MNRKQLLAFTVLISAGALFAVPETVSAASGKTPADQKKAVSSAELSKLNKKLLDKFARSLVDVEYFFRPDENADRICARCSSPKTGIVMECYTTQPGVQLYTGNWMTGNFVGKNGKRYPAKITAYYPEHRSVKLRTEQPVAGIVPLTFQKEGKEKKFAFFRVEEGGTRIASVRPYSNTGIVRNLASGKEYVNMPPNSLIVNEKGDLLGISMKNSLPFGMERNLNPQNWKQLPAGEFAKQLADFNAMLKQNIYPVRIRLKPVKQASGTRRYLRGKMRNEVDAFGIKLENGHILVAATLTPAETARLSGILVTVDGKSVPALKSFGRNLDMDVLTDEIRVLLTGFRGFQVPPFTSRSNMLVFKTDGELLSLLLERRRIRQAGGIKYPVSADMLREQLKDFDRSNVPRKGDEQIAWLGIEFQKLDPALARAKNAAELTADGRYGLLILSVYPDSPAAKLGLKDGDILISITPEGAVKPERLEGGLFRANRLDRFPWARYDEIPQQYYSEIPAPWGSTRNDFNEMLGRIGLGTRVRLGVVRNGAFQDYNLTISAAPPSFDTTEKFTDEQLGLSVCDLTYEVRNYFQMATPEGGILVAKVRPGGRAAVAGIKPYELIISVNGKAVSNLKEFKELIAGQKELRLGVRRLAVTRIVTVKLDNSK